jgi:hypothetical protein
MKKQSILAWHWCAASMKTQHTGEVISPTRKLTVRPPLRPCSVGLHASLDPFDALQYAPGTIICRVKLSGEIIKGDDKICAEHRELIWHANAETLLHEFACDCAERALHIAKVTDQRCHDAIRAKRRWLKKEITDRELDAAWDAAWAAAWAAETKWQRQEFNRRINGLTP